MKGRPQGMDRPVIVIIAAHRRKQKLMADHFAAASTLSEYLNDAWASWVLVNSAVKATKGCQS